VLQNTHTHTRKHTHSLTHSLARIKMNIPSPSCVNDITDYVDGIVHTPSPSADESRFFLPTITPYRSTSIYDAEDTKSHTTSIVNIGTSGRSMMLLFPDNRVSREIRSNIASLSDHEDSCGLRYRCANPKGSAHSEKSRPPLGGVVPVVDNGAPFMPLYRNQDADERLQAESKTNDENDDELYSCRPTMGFIQRTFSFDDHLPIIPHRRGASIRQCSSTLPLKTTMTTATSTNTNNHRLRC